MLGTRWQCTTVFSEEDIEWNKGGKAYFLLIRHFFISEMGKTSSIAKAGQNEAVTTLPKPLVAIGELQCDLH